MCTYATHVNEGVVSRDGVQKRQNEKEKGVESELRGRGVEEMRGVLTRLCGPTPFLIRTPPPTPPVIIKNNSPSKNIPEQRCLPGEERGINEGERSSILNCVMLSNKTRAENRPLDLAIWRPIVSMTNSFIRRWGKSLIGIGLKNNERDPAVQWLRLCLPMQGDVGLVSGRGRSRMPHKVMVK